jgi:pyruvate, water dikinase
VVIEGTVRVMRSLRQIPSDLSRQTILVVPYTDAGWSPILAQVGGIVAEVGGRLSHGAIVAREYGIPAVMDIAQATQRLKDGQRVTVDGYRGIVEIL